MNQVASTPSETPSIPISYTRIIARQLGLQEKELEHLMWKTGLVASTLTDNKVLLTNEQQLQVIRNALRISKEADFGLRLGQLLTPPTHGQIGFLANSSPNLITAIEAFQKFLPSRMNLTHLRVNITEESVECYLDIDVDNENAVYRCITECLTLSLTSLIEFILGRTFTEGHLYFSYEAPNYQQSYSNYLSCPLSFGADENKLIIPIALGRAPNITSDHVNYGFALRQCKVMLQQLDDSSDTSNQVKKILLSYPPGQLSEQAAADILFISKRTLARRLAREGYRYRQLRDEILSSMAANYLHDTELTVEAIANLLNYYDSSNFRRAFKRWHKQTPENFRKHKFT